MDHCFQSLQFPWFLATVLPHILISILNKVKENGIFNRHASSTVCLAGDDEDVGAVIPGDDENAWRLLAGDDEDVGGMIVGDDEDAWRGLQEMMNHA